jgi:hypothetical protein
MKILFDIPRILSAVLVISVSMLGVQLFVHPAISQVQSANNSDNNNTSSNMSSSPSSNSSTVQADSISIQLSKGYVNGKIAYFIATDASDREIAASITNNTGFKVNFAPDLASTPESTRQQGYVFINGIKASESPMEFQLGVASALPGDQKYSPLSQLNFVKWNPDATPRVLKSADEIMTAEKNGELSIAKTNIVINSPAVNAAVSGK